jgi:magnesium-transporting ATPase (P-type)
VLLESGDKVPADIRLTDVKNLRTEEAALTGESVPTDKTSDPVSARATVGDRTSMAFSGTLVVSGRATGVVVGTGSETELGRINQMLQSVGALETPLLRQIKKFGYAITAETAYEITGDGYADQGEVKQNGRSAGADEVLQLLGRASVLCNDAELRREDGVWNVNGDPTEGALYPFAAKVGVKRQAEQTAYPRIDSIPFESEHRFMATLHSAAGDGKVLFVKGAPEVILEHCDRQQTRDGGHAPINRNDFLRASDRLAGQGERVLALAWLENPDVPVGSLDAGDLPKNLVLLGLVGILDPPRKEAIEAVKECHDGGIRVTMITGDHRVTAAAIAKMLGTGDGKTAVIGTEIEDMDTAALQERCEAVDVFARASPQHKLRLVKAMQASKQIVAMTGDGVNDAPALKRADVGIAMGIKGTEVTKEAASVVLADDNFASIATAVREGRTVYNNIEKAILFMLPTNIAQGLIIMAAIFGGFTPPITAPQILWVNMLTSVALALVISFEPHERDVMRRRPRAVGRSIVTGFGVWRIIFIGVALLAFTLWEFFWTQSQGASDSVARTVAVNALTIGQVFYLLNSRYLIDSSLSIKAHRGNPYLPLGIGAVVVLQLLFTYWPPFQAVFGTAALPFRMWPRLLLGGFAFFLIVEAEKMVLRMIRSSPSARVSIDSANGLSRQTARSTAASPPW